MAKNTASKTASKRGKSKSTDRLSPEVIQAIKLASIKGVDDYTLAQEYGIAASTIRGRRRRDPEWKALVANPSGKKVQKTKENHHEIVAEKAGKIVNRSLEEIAEQNGLLVARFAMEKIEESVKHGMIEAPQNWSELSTAFKTLRTATGQDKAESQQVQISLFGGYSVGGQGVRDV